MDRPDATRKVFVNNSPNLDKPVRYLCQRCGNCCRWPGDVIVTREEVEKMAIHLEMDLDVFIQRASVPIAVICP